MADGESVDWETSLSEQLNREQWPEELTDIVEKLSIGTPLSKEDGVFLFNYKDIDTLGYLANTVKKARFSDRAFFNLNVHINQTNICTLACKFCAFRRGRRAADAYQMEIDEYVEDLRKYSEFVDEVHSVGGLHPEWDIDHYCKLFQRVKLEFPRIHIKALTAVEIKHIANLSGITVLETLSRLKDSGLGSLPGGGAEILDDDVREVICKGKESSDEYLSIHEAAHSIGLPTNCTMLFGTIETIEHRVEHMIKLRNLQEKTSGFQCLYPIRIFLMILAFPQAQLASGTEILRVIAISRLMLNNIPHIKAYRMNLGDYVAELALQFGADDIDGTVQKESIMHLAGSKASLDFDKNQIAKLVSNAGLTPIQRNTTYTDFVEYIPTKSPVIKTLQMAGGD